MKTDTITHAKQIWDYLRSFGCCAPSDAIVVCCSYDLRICDFACSLLKDGMADKLLFSGNSGNWTRHLWEEPEAHVFFKRAKANGVDPTKILVEDRATNIGENVFNTRQLMPDAQTITFVTKPNTILRVRLTATIQWPEITIHTACPQFSFPEEVSNVIGLLGVISEMVGDVERIMKYPELGYQAPHELPTEIVQSWKYLIKKGFTHHLMLSNKPDTGDGKLLHLHP